MKSIKEVSETVVAVQQQSSISLLKVDYHKMTLVLLHKLQHFSITYQTVVPVAPDCLLIVA